MMRRYEVIFHNGNVCYIMASNRTAAQRRIKDIKEQIKYLRLQK